MAEETSPPRLSRRGVLLGGAVAAGIGGAAVAVGVDSAVRKPAPQATTSSINGHSTVPFYGRHQAGIETPPQAHSSFIALDLKPEVDRDGLRRWMRILTDDAARMTQGEAALADMEAELATAPANLTVTFGFGPGFVARAGGSAPTWLAPLPAFTIDRLEPRWSNGDLLIHVGSDEPLTVAHTTRMLLKDSRSFATVRWVQDGFRRAHDTATPGTTMRNMFGQVDETVNLMPGTQAFANKVWSSDGWLAGGSSVVIRRIAMNLETWDQLDRSGREQSIGRTLANGAPLTGRNERDEPDFDAVGSNGFPVIADFAHIRRARGEDTQAGPQILRRGYSYATASTGASVTDAGLIFASYQADPIRQFVPIQQRLDQLDLLNQWTTPIGSAVFALPPGCAPGGYIGETLLS